MGMDIALLYVAGAALLGLAGVGVGVVRCTVSGGHRSPTRVTADVANAVLHRYGVGRRNPDYRCSHFALHHVCCGRRLIFFGKTR